jgi:fatty-acyl-CoA synthase
MRQQAGAALRRIGTEAHYAATLARVAVPAAVLTPPHRYLRIARAYADLGAIGAVTAYGAATQRDRPAIIDDRGSLSFRDLDSRSTALAGALYARGVRSDDGVGILCRNHRGFLEALFAAGKLGARTVLLNTDFSGPQLIDVCARESVSLLIHDEEFADIAVDVETSHGRVVAWADAQTSDLTIDDLVRMGRTTPPPRPAASWRLVLLTSGTTGTPKGAPRELGDNKPSLAGPGSVFSRIPFRARRTVFVAAPMFHAWGLGGAFMAFGLGSTIVTTRRFEPLAVVSALEAHRCDVLLTVPIVLARLLDGADDLPHRDLSALRIVALSGSALSAELASRAMNLLGEVVYNLYGSTEVGYAAIATPAELRAKPATVGRPPRGTVVRLLDEHDREVPAGGSGRIFVDNGVQFAGYTGGGTKETVGRLMSTGDVGHFDADGYLYVDGRADDMIVSGGENVFPREIEELLSGRSDVVDAAVTGVADDQFGQRLRAYVVAAPGADLDADGLREFVKANLARYKVPRDVVIVDEIPRNPAGKIMKRLLPDPALPTEP